MNTIQRLADRGDLSHTTDIYIMTPAYIYGSGNITEEGAERFLRIRILVSLL